MFHNLMQQLCLVSWFVSQRIKFFTNHRKVALKIRLYDSMIMIIGGSNDRFTLHKC